MLFQQIILHMIHRLNGERTISAPFHLLRGKRSGQTIQDAKSYSLTSYFSLTPKLSRKTYDQIIQKMVQSHLLTIDGDTIPHITVAGIGTLQKMPGLSLNGWLYRGNELLFFQRLSLVTQTLSHVVAGSMAFTPVQKDEKIQNWVRDYLKQFPYKTKKFNQNYYYEMKTAFQTSDLTQLHLSIISHRLSGFEVSGVTWQQLSHALHEDELDLQIRFSECLHILLDEIHANTKLVLLGRLSEGIRTATPLTDSAKKTADFYKQGFDFEQIISLRQLKPSTIEDHFVEMAMNDPSFSIQSFFPEENTYSLIEQINTHKTKKLRTLKEAYPAYSYFQLRLLLAAGGDSHDNGSI